MKVTLYIPNRGDPSSGTFDFATAPRVGEAVLVNTSTGFEQFVVEDAWHCQEKEGSGFRYFAVLKRDEEPKRRWLSPEDYPLSPIPSGT